MQRTSPSLAPQASLPEHRKDFSICCFVLSASPPPLPPSRSLPPYLPAIPVLCSHSVITHAHKWRQLLYTQPENTQGRWQGPNKDGKEVSAYIIYSTCSVAADPWAVITTPARKQPSSSDAPMNSATYSHCTLKELYLNEGTSKSYGDSILNIIKSN